MANSFFYICEFLGIAPQEFVDKDNAEPEKLREFIKEAKKLDGNTMNLILALMKQLNGHK